MNEASAEYLAEFVNGRVYDRFGSALGQMQLVKMPRGEDVFRLVIPVLGARTSSKVFAMLASTMGNQRELEFPPGSDNINITRRLTGSKFPRPSGWKEAPWVITIGSEPDLRLPEGMQCELDAITGDFVAAMQEEEAWQDSFALDDDGRDDDEPTERDADADNLFELLVQIAAVGQTLPDWHELRIGGGVSVVRRAKAKSFVTFLHGFNTLFRAQEAIRRVVAHVPSVNTVELINLKQVKIEAPGWLGRYALTLAETVHVRTH